MRRHGLRLVGAIGVLALAGCAVGKFIAGAPSSKPNLAADGLLARRCGGCHAVPDPNAMTRDEWHGALASMQQRMMLPASEWDSLAAMRR